MGVVAPGEKKCGYLFEKCSNIPTCQFGSHGQDKNDEISHVPNTQMSWEE